MSNWDSLIEILLLFRDKEELEAVTLETKIEADLGISGDDAHDFLREYSTKLNIDISKFHFRAYFVCEAGIYFQPFADSITGRKRKSLTLGQLIKGIDVGYLE